jgi:hypothetical protein
MRINIAEAMIPDLEQHAKNMNTDVETLVNLLVQDYLYFKGKGKAVLKIFPPDISNMIPTIKFVRNVTLEFPNLNEELTGLKHAKEFVQAIRAGGSIVGEVADVDRLKSYAAVCGQGVNYEINVIGHNPFKLPEFEHTVIENFRRLKFKKHK